MPLSNNQFLREISEYKHAHGFIRHDDEYRKKFWLPNLPPNYKAQQQKKRRLNWQPTKSEVGRTKISLGAGVPVPKALAHLEEPSRCIDRGWIRGVSEPVPRYVNRGPPVASEFQGARTSPRSSMGPFFPRYIPKRTANYLQRRIPARHSSCVPVNKTSATLWRDWFNSELDNKNVSNVATRYYHPLTASANKRFNARWPEWRKQQHSELYFHEFCQLHHQPSRVFASNWIDEQLIFPYVDHVRDQDFKDSNDLDIKDLYLKMNNPKKLAL
ncbi:uncharacterized protein CDAR_188641 [Caerostris darwini]|uniref:Uncharacterized protein n=1 Tax=Caerostris darwini TaxID=1538125 RepID=A0AAV4Q2G9_9ARAC|nr:uncharacterized protein CDAR_188641 [Caerostris darwini]